MHNSATNLINLQGFLARKRRQKVTGVRSGKRHLSLYKAIGAMAFLAMVSAFAFSLWFGANIEKNLRQLAENRQAVSQAKVVNEELRKEKARLFSKERVQAVAAVKLGLYPSKEKNSGERGIKVRL